MKAAILLLLAASVNGKPANQEDDANVASNNLHFDADENFKAITAEYVNSEYKNLSEKEKEDVNANLDKFLLTLAKDLTEVFNKNYTKSEVGEEIRDGIEDEEFESIKKTVVKEFPEVNEEVATEIVYRLRKNLLVTRENLKRILSPEEE